MSPPERALRLRHVRILVVDDSTAVRSRLVAMFAEQEGVDSVAEASDGNAAIAQIDALRPDLVVLDLHLPKRSGLEVLSHYQYASRRPSFIVLTNEATGHHRRQSKLLGADHFFDKTVELDAMFALVAELVASSSPSDGHLPNV